jgi:8-amino-7-oxononanoate synthase
MYRLTEVRDFLLRRRPPSPGEPAFGAPGEVYTPAMRATEAGSGVRVVVAGRALVSFAGCDYLGLARDPRVVAAAREALDRCGVGATASRTTTGTWSPHLDAEAALAGWMQADDAVLLASGWLAGRALVAALSDGATAVIVDDARHPALADAAALAGLPVRSYAHFDAAAARRACGADRPLVLTDAVDVVTGAAAPLRKLATLVEERDGVLVVDDAHGLGVLGPGGRGAAAAVGARSTRVHVAGSLSKAIGAHGGFVFGTRDLCDAVRARFAGYAGATPIPPAIAAAVASAVHLVADGDDLRRRLQANAALLRRRLRAGGHAVPSPRVPWFAIGAGASASRLRRASARLARDGFLVPHLTYFGAPAGGYLKVAVTAAHAREEVEALADAIDTAFADVRRSPPMRRARRSVD